MPKNGTNLRPGEFFLGFQPLKSDLGVFWHFRGPDFIMGKNKNANFSKSPHGPIFKFFVVIREVILQKMAPILAPVNFFSVLTLLADCAGFPTGNYHKMIIQFLLQFFKIHFVKTIDSELLTNILSQLKNKSFL